MNLLRDFRQPLNQSFRILFVFFLLLSTGITQAQVKVILDTDPSFDPDDAGCMAMLHTLANQGKCEILAMVNSTNHKESSMAISAINHFYSRKAIPVGDYKGYAEKVDAPENTYDGHLARKYTHSIKSVDEALDGVKLYREVLASAADRSITVVIIGTMHNFYGLLKSAPDQWSDLDGEALVAKKVAQVVTMGGNFIDGKGLDRTNWGGAEELCSYTDWSCVREERNRMCRYVIEHCPAPFIASGWEVGCGDYYNANYGNVITGQSLKFLPADHIIRRSYEYHFDFRGGSEDISRHSNDQCALHYAILGESNNYVARTNGKIKLSDKGVCLWEEQKGGVQGYIQKKRHKDEIAKEIEALMMGEVMAEDNSQPTAPKNIQYITRNGKPVLIWEPATDPSPGSWVVGYQLYVDGQPMARLNGTQYVGNLPKGDIELRSINVNGLESEPTSFAMN